MGEAQGVEVEETHGMHERHIGRRLVGFVRRRPILSLGILAGAGALGGIEWAAGALLGLGAAALVATNAGRDLRHQLGARARHVFEQGQHDGEETQQPPQPA